MNTNNSQWWHDSMNGLAAQLSNGVLKEMKMRIRTTNIKREKLELDEDTDRMREFFQREIARYTKRKAYVQSQKHDYPRIIKQLVECNLSLARKCRKHKVAITKVLIEEPACYTWS